MIHPLLSCWRLGGRALPDRLTQDQPAASRFTLPGADALTAFADLIGEPDLSDEAPAPVQDVPFALPALIPQDMPGEATLTCEIDFSTISGERALLSFDMLCGSGSIQAEILPPRHGGASPDADDPVFIRMGFHDGPLTLDLTPALLARRRCRIALCFGSARPAGVCGAVTMRTAQAAMLGEVFVEPLVQDGAISLRTDVTAMISGEYILRAQFCPADPNAQPPAAIRETALRLNAGECRGVALTLSAQADPFSPGQSYAAPGVKLWLHKKKSSGGVGLLCDDATRMTGFPGSAPRFWLPLGKRDHLLPPQALLDEVQALNVHAVSLCAAAPDLFYRLFTRAGVSVLQAGQTPKAACAGLSRYPCVTLDASLAPEQEILPILSAWRLCGLTTYERPADPLMSDADMLRDAAGQTVHPASDAIADTLAWLRAFSVRLRAEAVRQGKAEGALCAPGEFHEPDVAQAIGRAFDPVHLSALPLRGAWWAGAHFSASLQAFIPQGILSADHELRAEAILEDAQGQTIARTQFPCAPWRSGCGMLEGRLPAETCVLELITRLYADDRIIEESSMPVYVGERGPLEAALCV